VQINKIVAVIKAITCK